MMGQRCDQLSQLGIAMPGTQSWLFDSSLGGPPQLMWRAYKEQYLGRYGQYQHLHYHTLAGRRLGCGDLNDVAIGEPRLLTEKSALECMQNRFKDGQGRPLQRLFGEDLNSEVMESVMTTAPSAVYLLKNALGLIRDSDSDLYKLLCDLVTRIVPIYHEKFGGPFRRGFTHSHHLGAIFMTFQEREDYKCDLAGTTLAVDLCHELGHHILMVYQASDPILESDPSTPVYSAVRRTKRAAIMAFHACFATSFMMRSCDRLVELGVLTEYSEAYLRNSLLQFIESQQQAFDSLDRSVKYTKVGQCLREQMGQQLRHLKSKWPGSTDAAHSYFGISGLL